MSFSVAARAALACAALVLASARPATPAAAPSRPADPLPRRGAFGARIAPLAPADRARLGLAAEAPGIRVDSVFARSTAAAAGFARGDVLLAAGGRALANPGALTQALSGRHAGDTLSVIALQDGKPVARVLRLRAPAAETGDGYLVEYGSVASRGGRLRTTWTRPPTPGRHPGFLMVQGIGVVAMDNLDAIPSYGDIVRDFARRGFVTLRVDKPGCGDSEGGPLRDVDFDTQLDGFRQGLAALRSDPGVDPDRILIFGHSMGGVWGPLLAAETPVRGLAVCGTVSRTWTEYVLENTRRQAALSGIPADEIDRRVKDLAAADHYLGHDGLSVAEMLERHPETRAWCDSNLVEGRYYSGLNAAFLHQLGTKNLAGAWAKLSGRALAAWGRGDFLSDSTDHQMIAGIVNAAHPGYGRYLALDMDHAFRPIASRQESIATWGQPRGTSPLMVETLRAWSEEVLKPEP